MILTVIIVTKDRPQELRNCLLSLREQTQPADQIIVVEGGESMLTDARGIEYYRSAPGITRQRNVARTHVRPDCDIVVYIDDDTKLPPDTLRHIEKNFTERADIVGLTGNIVGEQPHSLGKRLLGWLTFLYTDRSYGLTPGIFNIINQPIQAQPVAWLPGAFMCYRWAKVRDLAFDEWFAAYGLGEDLDFSLQVKKRGQLWVEPTLQIEHYHSPVGRDWKKFGYMRIVNRHYIRRKHFARRFSYWLGTWWASSWLLIMNGIRALYSARFRAEWQGELRGFLKLFK